MALLNLIPPRDQAAYAVCVPLFQRASEGDDVPATYTYASMLLRGMGTPADEGRAAQLFARLAKMGQAQSQFILAGLYADGKGVKASYKRAMDLYKQAAEQGVAAAYNPIGVFFRDGQGGIPQDYAQALHYFQKGADLGDPLALVSLAHMYTHGKGVDVDHTRAFELHKQAAEHDVPIAIYNLGWGFYMRYLEGCGAAAAGVLICFAALFFQRNTLFCWQGLPARSRQGRGRGAAPALRSMHSPLSLSICIRPPTASDGRPMAGLCMRRSTSATCTGSGLGWSRATRPPWSCIGRRPTRASTPARCSTSSRRRCLPRLEG